MAVSTSIDFTRTRDQIIARAGRLTGAIRAGETMGSQEVTDFAEALNAMVKRWAATPGLQVWCTSEATAISRSVYFKAMLPAAHTGVLQPLVEV